MNFSQQKRSSTINKKSVTKALSVENAKAEANAPVQVGHTIEDKPDDKSLSLQSGMPSTKMPPTNKQSDETDIAKLKSGSTQRGNPKTLSDIIDCVLPGKMDHCFGKSPKCPSVTHFSDSLKDGRTRSYSDEVDNKEDGMFFSKGKPNPKSLQTGNSLKDQKLAKVNRVEMKSTSTQTGYPRSYSDVLDYAMPVNWDATKKEKSPKSHKKVSFDSHSEVALYEVCRTHKKSYTARQEQLFHAQAILEAYRIRDVILSRRTNTRNPIRSLIEQDILSAEEIVGLEDKISDISGKKKAYENHIHAAFLLDQQKKLRSENNEVDPEKLAAAAAASSSKNVRKARGRAALAA